MITFIGRTSSKIDCKKTSWYLLIKEDEKEKEEDNKHTKRKTSFLFSSFDFFSYLEDGFCLFKHCGLVFSSSSPRSSSFSINGVELLEGEQWLFSGIAKGDGGEVETEQQRSSNDVDDILSWFDEHDDWSKCAKGLK